VAGWEKTAPNLAQLESLDQTVLMSVTVTMGPLVTEWTESASASQAMQGTGARTTALKDILEKIATQLVSVNLRTISATQHVGASVNQDTEAITVPLPSPAWLCTQSHPLKMLVTRDSFLEAFLPLS